MSDYESGSGECVLRFVGKDKNKNRCVKVIHVGPQFIIFIQ